MNFEMPAQVTKVNGEPRRVGFELEFGGVPVETVPQVVCGLFGGRVERTSRFYYKVTGSPLGEFKIGVDSSFFRKETYKIWLRRFGVNPAGAFVRRSEYALERCAGTLVPIEIAMPPLPINNLYPAEVLRRELRHQYAVGTKSHFYSALALQINPDVPDLSVRTILNYLRAFFLLYDWLWVQEKLSWSRALLPFVRNFPLRYVRLVLNPNYAPDMSALARDYVRYNSTRNRPLDLLPLLCHLRPEILCHYPIHHRGPVRPRPAFHYRLPSSEMNRTDWSIAAEWNRWVKVENLANNPERLSLMGLDYSRTRTHDDWAAKTMGWLHA